MTDKPRGRWRLPAWAILLIGACAVGAGLIWASTIYDDHGNEALDSGTVQLLVVLVGAVVTMFSLLLQRQGETKDHLAQTSAKIEHEFAPNHGTSMRDSNDRIERLLTDLARDVGGLREENRDDRRAAEVRFGELERRQHDTATRLHQLESKKEINP